MLAIGALVGAVGSVLLLVGAGILPPPGGPKSLHAHLWIVLVVGLVVTLAAAALLLQSAAGEITGNGELPRNAPYWMRVSQYFLMLTMFAAFAVIGTWVSIGSGEREISMSMPFLNMQAGDFVGRVAFGIGAALAWLCTLMIAVSGVRKLRDKT
jgi:hypothetical protein